MSKPKYKISASLINSYLYHMNNQSKNSREGLENRLKGIFISNHWLDRGKRYERQVSAGMHKKVSDTINHLEKEVWLNGVLEHPDFTLKISGKMDAWDSKQKIIYDTKRIDTYYPGKYDNSVTIQHALYFYLNKDAKSFVYLIAAGKDDNVDQYVEHVVKRPTKKKLDQIVVGTIVEFINYLKYEDLWMLYIANHKANW